MRLIIYSLLTVFLVSCGKKGCTDPTATNYDSSAKKEDNSCNYCYTDQVLDNSRGACDQTLNFNSLYNETTQGNNRVITANSIPNHDVGLFGPVMGGLNPNAISPQNESYTIPLNPIEANEFTSLLGTSGINLGPQYSFGILFNGVELDPVAAEPFPHEGMNSSNANWIWNLEALNVNLGVDCNNAHVQPNGKYHYHGTPTSYLNSLNASSTTMTIIGYAADGFPVYYKYAYSLANNSSSDVSIMTSSYQLKSGNRPGDGESAPCDSYNGVYSNDYEYVYGLGTLDEANGRNGVTPEYPNGTYYYVITDEFPSIPRYLRGTPSMDFKIGQ
jgi:hypothetical protein